MGVERGGNVGNVDGTLLNVQVGVGYRFLGVKVGERGQTVIHTEARVESNIKPGDLLLHACKTVAGRASTII